MARADVVIDNTGSLASFRDRVRAVLDADVPKAGGGHTEPAGGGQS
jgi:hypothetical protein